MAKRSFILVVSILAVSLVGPAPASADHPWSPPGWWSEVVSGGEMDERENRSSYDCELHRTTHTNSYGDHFDHHSLDCSRRYPSGFAQCSGDTWHTTNNSGHALTPPTSYRREFSCRIQHPGDNRACGWYSLYEDPDQGYNQDAGWIDAQTKQPDPDCFERIKRPQSAPDGDGDGFADGTDQCPTVPGVFAHGGCPPPPPPSSGGARGHDLVSLCGKARFGWYPSSIGGSDVSKGDDVCLHMVSNRVAQELAAEGLAKATHAFGRRLMEHAKGQLDPTPDATDYLELALPSWSRALQTVGRLNVLTSIGEAVGLALARRFARQLEINIERKDACLTFVTRKAANFTVDGSDGGSSFGVDKWQFVFNREYVKRPISNRHMYTATVMQKYPRRLRGDKWKVRFTSMQCGKGGKVFTTARHDESKIVSNRVRAAG